VREKFKQGMTFKLFIFPKQSCFRATWEGVFSNMNNIFGEAIAEKILSKKKEIIDTRFLDLQTKTCKEVEGFDTFFDVCKRMDNDDVWMSEKNFKKCKGELWQCRCFLYECWSLSELYRGDGFTQGSDSKTGMQEFITKNIPVREMERLMLIEIPLTLELYEKQFVEMMEKRKN